jgi:DNA-directed RNA polymerase specialized sigma24 family protein
VSSLYYKSLAEQADATVNAHYRELEGEVLRAVQSRLAARRMQMDRSDVEEAYCLAWNGVWELIKRGEEIRSLTATLIEITWRRAVDTYRELRTGQYADVEIEERPGEQDFIEQLDDRLKLQRLIRRLRERLNAKECEAVSLCVIQGYSRREAGEMLGMEESALQRLMDSATLKLGGVIASIDARGCGDGEWTRLLRAFALGVLSEEDRDHSRATAHIETCAPCRRYVMCLRGLAAVMPPMGLPLMPAGGHEAGILAHLEKVLSSGHSGAAGAATAVQGGAGVGVAGGGWLGSLSTGAVLKGAAVLAVAGVAAVSVGGHSGRQPRHPPARPAVSGVSTQVAGLVPTQPIFSTTHVARRVVRHARGYPRSRTSSGGRVVVGHAEAAAIRELGFERQPSPSTAPARPASAQPASASTGGSGQVSKAARELQFER